VQFVKKKDGSLRPCMDYRSLNFVTKKDSFPLPLIDILLDRKQNTKIYTRLDLRYAYHLIILKKVMSIKLLLSVNIAY
jgi:hypothetical protein